MYDNKFLQEAKHLSWLLLFTQYSSTAQLKVYELVLTSTLLFGPIKQRRVVRVGNVGLL